MKQILFLALLLATVGMVHAQQYRDTNQPVASNKRIKENRLRFGAFIAPSISWLQPATKNNADNNMVKSDGSRAGYAGGLLVDYYITPNYCIATGLSLDKTGGIITTAYASGDYVAPNTVYSTKFNYNLQYLEIPLNFKLRSNEISSGLRVFGQVGASAAINVGKRASYTVLYTDDNSIIQTQNGDNKPLRGALSVAPVIFALNVGAGLEYALTHQLRFYTGLFINNSFSPDVTRSNNYELGYNGDFKDGNIKASNLSLRLGLLF